MTHTPETRVVALDNCHHFSISGGTFSVQGRSTNDDGDFRRIRPADVRLLQEVRQQNVVEYQEIRHKRTGAVKRRVPFVVGSRKIYHAWVVGYQNSFTAVVYEGSHADRHRVRPEWRHELWHPAFLQLFAVTSGCHGPEALIYHDRFIPIDSVRKMHQQSPLASAYVEHAMGKHFEAARIHWLTRTGSDLIVHDPFNSLFRLETGIMMWLCISTGQLCLEVREDKENEYQRLPWSPTHGPNPLDIDLTSDPNWDQIILSRMTVDDIHRILCNTGYWTPMRISGAGIVLLGSLSCRNSTTSDHFDPFSKFALSDSLESADLYSSAWKCSYGGDGPSPEVKEGDGDVSFSGWTRVAITNIPTDAMPVYVNKYIGLDVACDTAIQRGWLSQANHVMTMTAFNADQYVTISGVEFCLSIFYDADEFTLQGTFMADTPTHDVYLFLFPAEAEASEGRLTVPLPPENETYYWSLDPQGADRLSEEASAELGFPRVHLTASMRRSQWDETAYDLIREVHISKGFKPDTQDVARALGYPLVDVRKLHDMIHGSKVEVLDEVQDSEAEIQMGPLWHASFI